MQATISNFRGISAATLDISRIALIAGSNGAGKSSACQALAAALTGEPVPMEGVTKTQAGVLVRSGTATGSVTLTTEAGSSEITWPAAKVKTTGAPVCASRFATGLESIVTMDAKKRTAFLIDYLKAQPTKDQLTQALAPLNFPAPQIDKLWELIQTTGWDGAHAQIKEKGAKLKGQWELIANDNYGAKKAESWIPQGYSPDLEGASEDTLKAVVTDARDALEAAIAASAVDDSKRAELQALADLLPERQAALDLVKQPLAEDTALKDATAALQTARVALAKAQQDLATLRGAAPKQGEPPRKLFCSCGKELMLDALGNLCDYAVSGPTQAEIDAHGKKVSDQVKATSAAEKAVTQAEAALAPLQSARQAAVNEWNAAIATAAAAVTEASNAARELADRPAAPVDAFHASVEDCRNDLAAHELRLRAFTAKRDADRLHGSIELNQALLGHIAPGGVRADVLQHALGNFNTGLTGLCQIAGWPAVQIERDFSFTYQGTPYYLCSGGEQYRVRTIVQMAMARREQAGMVICDGADILDRSGRNGLFKLLKAVGIPALVGMTIIGGEGDVPKLGAAGMGVAYWIDGAVTREVG